MNRKTTWTLALFIGILSGCGAARPSEYYHLTVADNPPATADQDPYPVTLVLGRVTSPNLYRQDHLVWSSDGQSMGVYEYQRWVESPTEMLADVLVREFRDSESYQGVYSEGSNVHGDYLLRVQLYDFEEISQTPLVARLSFDCELREVKSGTTVWTHYYTHDEPVSRKAVSAVAAALDRNVQMGVSECKASLDHYFSTHSPVDSVAR